MICFNYSNYIYQKRTIYYAKYHPLYEFSILTVAIKSERHLNVKKE